MNKLVKKISVGILSLTLCGAVLPTANSMNAFAEEISENIFDETNDYFINDIDTDLTTFEHYYFGGFRKKNVSIFEEYGSYERVSDNITGNGSITSTRTVTKSNSVSGNIYGIVTINSSVSETSGVGYTLQTPGYGTYYMAVRPVYKVETGIRVKEDVFGGSSSNYYKVKVPMYFEFKLIKVR